MKNTMKRLTALVLILFLASAVSALAESTAGDYTYQLAEDGSARITGYQGEDPLAVLPDRIGGAPVTAIASDAFLDCADLEEVRMPGTLRTIESSAFNGCSAMEHIVLAETVSAVGPFAFQNCASLATAYVPALIRSLDSSAFRGSPLLAEIYFGGTEEEWAEIGKDLEMPEDCTVIFNHRHEDSGNGRCVCFKPVGGHAGHTFSDPVYEWSEDKKSCTASRICDCGEPETETVPVDVKTRAASCTAGGQRTLTASFTNAAFEEQTETVKLPAAGHKPVEAAAVRGTCINPGTTAGTVCSVCGTILEGCTMGDKDPDNHVGPMTHPDDILATCIATGYHFEAECQACGAIIGNELPPDPTRHDGTLWSFPAADPTCTENGNTAYWHCPRCEKYYSDAAGLNAIASGSWVIPALGHAAAEDPAVEPTCTETGLSKGSHCTRCGEVLVPQETVPALGHEYGEDGLCIRCGAPID